MIYELSDAAHGDSAFAGVASVIEEHIPSRHTPLFYGIEFERKLEFSIVFGMNMSRVDSGVHMSREEENEIASWLIGHNGYKYLTVDQEDLYDVRFKCMVTELEPIRYGLLTWAMRATFVCDGPYAYRYPSSTSFELNGTREISFFNYSSHNGYYRPVVEYSPTSGGDLIIINESDGGRTFSLMNIPAAALNIVINNDTLVITNSADLNLYDCFNKVPFRLKKGTNVLTVTGNGVLTIHTEFPVNVSG